MESGETRGRNWPGKSRSAGFERAAHSRRPGDHNRSYKIDYPTTELLRIANPTELLRAPASDTINYGFLQSTDTQKALFLTPSFKQGVDDTFEQDAAAICRRFPDRKIEGNFPKYR